MQAAASFYSRKDFNLIKKGIISIENMRYSGNHIYDGSLGLWKGFLIQRAVLAKKLWKRENHSIRLKKI